MKSWGISDALKMYNIENWGEQFFNINPFGRVVVYPRMQEGPGVDLVQVVEEIRERGLELPVMIRFQDILRKRVVALNESFAKAIAENEYKGKYRGVYPIKVNQMREVVEEIIDAGRPYHYGLEAGSKGELATVIAMDTSPEALTICNGYKDYEFIKLALMGVKLGKRVLIVVEKLSDLYLTLAVSKELGVQPEIGVRCKLSTKGSGKWEGSGGETAKFGLSMPELVHLTKVLEREGLLDAFKLLHFHIGSQVSNIATINEAVREASRIYAKLRKMGLKVEFLDVGGGLGVDYDGSNTSYESSINYTLPQYCEAIVCTIQEICRAEKVPEPNIVSESGRAIVAHHAVLIVNVFGSIAMGTMPSITGPEAAASDHDVVKAMRAVLDTLSAKNVLESFQEAAQRKEECLSLFRLGFLSLEDRAIAESLYWDICRKIAKFSKEMKYIPEELDGFEKLLADQYLCNFSLFQSMPDHWAIQQLFPILPIHRLNEEPTKASTLVDITCDSDGKICKFIDTHDVKETLPLHTLQDREPYWVGFFLMGAYQDIMGDLHNLFGRVHEVHVFLDETEPGGYFIEEIIPGHRVSDVLSWIQYNPANLEKLVKERIDRCVREGHVKPREGVDLLNFFERVLNGYTYISPAKPPAVSEMESQLQHGTASAVK